jgi:hypothetical protein
VSPLKLLFDENFGKPIITALGSLLYFHPEQPIVRHLLEHFPSGTPDLEWIPKIATEGWVVVSCDRGKRCGGAKLPTLCAEFKATHILLTASILNLKQFEKARIVITLWPEIAGAADAPAGTRFQLRILNGRPSLVKSP